MKSREETKMLISYIGAVRGTMDGWHGDEYLNDEVEQVDDDWYDEALYEESYDN
tara:strand:- start:148 stop:309 length:162 start_codon:yes stop_codon:yes gene_type:complete